jgi:serine/threonine-protein kinase RsbW
VETHTEQGLWDPVGLELPKNPAWVGVARLAAAGIAYRAGMAYDAIEDVKIIVAEAVSYCIQHGQPGGRLRISFKADTKSLTVEVRDPEFPAITGPPKDREGSNYRTFVDGLFLIRGLADDVEYIATPSEGLTLRIRRGIA